MRMDARAETAWSKVITLALFGDIGLVWRRAFDGVLTELVRRPERVEYDSGIRQQVFAPFLFQTQRIGKDRKRIGFREIGNGVKISPLKQFVNFSFGGRRETLAYLLQRRRRQNLAEDCAGPGVRWRIGFEDNAWRTPRLFFCEVA